MSSIRFWVKNVLFFSSFGKYRFFLFQCFCLQAADGDGNRARCGFTITVKPQPTFNPLQVSVGCFTLTVYQPSIHYKGVFVDIWTVVTLTTPTSSSSSATKFSESAASLPTSSTSEADLAVLTRQVFKMMLFCRHKRS